MNAKENIDTCLTPIFRGDDKTLNQIKLIDSACFDGSSYTDEELAEMKADYSVVVLLELDGKIIGYSYARPVDKIWPNRSNEDKTVNISSTAILPEYQNRGFVRILNKKMETELKKRGYEYMEGNADENNGYADAIAMAYAKRIVSTERNIPASRSGDGLKGFFKISL